MTGRKNQIAFRKPKLYQTVGSERRPIEGRFTLFADNTVGFSVAKFNRSQPLVIDPVLVYSTFLSSSGTLDGDFASGLAVDLEGNSYIAGSTYSTDFPATPSAFRLQHLEKGTQSAFVRKLNPEGTALLYSTYLGGSSFSAAYSIKVDSAGNAYVAGTTDAAGFPTTKGAFQAVTHERGGGTTGFVTKLNPNGSELMYSTFLGGSGGEDVVSKLAIDASGNAYLTGYTVSTNFPATEGTLQSVSKAAAAVQNGFVTKLNPTGTALEYSTYLGGTRGARGCSITVDSSGNAYIVGSTASSDFPVTSGAYQTDNRDTTSGVGFVTKLNSSGTAEIYSTYLGGHGLANAERGDQALDIAVDSSRDAYIAGETASADFPVTEDAYQTIHKGWGAGSITGFVTKLNQTGTGLVFSTYLGGTGQYTKSLGGGGESAGSIAIDSTGDVFVAGSTGSFDFPVSSDAYQTEKNHTSRAVGFVTEFNPSGSKILYSTYFGGSVSSSLHPVIQTGDSIDALTLDTKGDVYIAGRNLSTGFPITNGAFQITNRQRSAGRTAAFVSKFGFGPTTPVTTTTEPTVSITAKTYTAAHTVATGSAVVATPTSLAFPVTTIGASDPPETVTLKNTSKTAISALAITIIGADASSFKKTQSCKTTLGAGATCTVSVAMEPQVTGNLTAALQIAGTGTTTSTVGLGGFSGDPTAIAPDAYTYKISTTQGDIYIELQPKSAPNNVKNFLYYVKKGTYNNSIIHRVIESFIVQGGGYKLNGAGQIIASPTTTPVRAEVKLSNLRGTLATAGAGTNTDQFFFNVEDNPSLNTQDGGYTVFAKIVGVQGVNTASPSISLAVMDAISFDTVYDFASPFNQLPLLNYTDGAKVEPSNYVCINSITLVTGKPHAPDTPVFSIGTGTYHGPQTVSIKDSTPGAVIYYYPFDDTGTTAIQYKGPFVISKSQYIVTYATAPGDSNISYYNYEYIGISN